MKYEINDKKIEEVLSSMDDAARAKPHPFLFTRIEARMNNEKNIWWKISAVISRPVVAFACICFVLIMNAMVILFTNQSTYSFSQQGTELATADEYSQVSTALYDFENTKP